MIRAPVCSCGGRLVEASAAIVDLEPLFGIRGRSQGPVPALRCERCGELTFEAVTIERMLVAVARHVLGQDHVLTPEEARFVRKAVLRSTQEKLALRMGINKITVADWERGERPLSKEHDYELRGIALSDLLSRRGPPLRRQIDALAEEMPRILTAPRTARPPRRAVRYVIPASELAAA